MTSTEFVYRMNADVAFAMYVTSVVATTLASTGSTSVNRAADLHTPGGGTVKLVINGDAISFNLNVPPHFQRYGIGDTIHVVTFTTPPYMPVRLKFEASAASYVAVSVRQ